MHPCHVALGRIAIISFVQRSFWTLLFKEIDQTEKERPS